MKAILNKYAICARHIYGGIHKDSDLSTPLMIIVNDSGMPTPPDPPIREGSGESETETGTN